MWCYQFPLVNRLPRNLRHALKCIEIANLAVIFGVRPGSHFTGVPVVRLRNRDVVFHNFVPSFIRLAKSDIYIESHVKTSYLVLMGQYLPWICKNAHVFLNWNPISIIDNKWQLSIIAANLLIVIQYVSSDHMVRCNQWQCTFKCMIHIDKIHVNGHATLLCYLTHIFIGQSTEKPSLNVRHPSPYLSTGIHAFPDVNLTISIGIQSKSFALQVPYLSRILFIVNRMKE